MKNKGGRPPNTPDDPFVEVSAEHVRVAMAKINLSLTQLSTEMLQYGVNISPQALNALALGKTKSTRSSVRAALAARAGTRPERLSGGYLSDACEIATRSFTDTELRIEIARRDGVLRAGSK